MSNEKVYYNEYDLLLAEAGKDQRANWSDTLAQKLTKLADDETKVFSEKASELSDLFEAYGASCHTKGFYEGMLVAYKIMRKEGSQALLHRKMKAERELDQGFREGWVWDEGVYDQYTKIIVEQELKAVRERKRLQELEEAERNAE
jgi:hypothetical protein